MPTVQDPFGAGISIPPFLSGKQIYNQIMGQIEPELTTDVLPTLQEKYKGETPEQEKVRVARYNKAFREYDVRFEEENRKWNEQWKAYKHAAFASAEKGDHMADQNAATAAIEQAVQSL